MSSVFTKISRFSNTIENIIAIEMKVTESDISLSRSLRSTDFYVTDTETCFLEYCMIVQDKTLALHLRGMERQNMLLRFIIFVTDGNGACLHSCENTADILNISLDNNDLFVGFTAKHWEINYPLYITCYLETQNAEKSINPEVELRCLRNLSADFRKILDQGTEADVTLNVDGVNIKANKMILCARSPVFNKMFEHDTRSVIGIEDIPAPIMEELVSFLYSGMKKYHEFEEECQLYYAADKYEVLSLRDACKNDLLDQLQVGNACQMLILANRHGDLSFKKEILKFIHWNFKSVVNTESFAEVIKSYADIALSLLRFHANSDQ